MVRLSATFAAVAALAVSSCVAFTPNAQKNGIASKAASAFGGIVPSSDGQSQSSSETEMSAMLTQTELPEKLYFGKEKELPKVLGGLKIGTRELVVVTGASSGLGLNAAATLAKTGRFFVVMACRDVEKAKAGEF